MPLFEYRCGQCNEKFEELVKADTKVTCPRCGSSQVTKLISGFGFRTTGSSIATSSGCSGCTGGSCAGCH